VQSLRFFGPALLSKQIGQPPGGVLLVGVGPTAQPVQVTAFCQQSGQDQGGIPAACGVGSGVGVGAQLVQVVPLG